MTRDGLTEENLHDGSVKDISHRSRGRPETKEEFVPERERKKAENEDSKSGKGKRLQMEKIRKSSVRQEAVENTVEVTPEEKVSGYKYGRVRLHHSPAYGVDVHAVRGTVDARSAQAGNGIHSARLYSV